MKTALGILTGLALCVGSTLVPQFGTQAIAADESKGCCKVRESLSEKNWDREKLKNFSEKNCEDFNTKEDGDVYAKEEGYVWWDAQCKK